MMHGKSYLYIRYLCCILERELYSHNAGNDSKEACFRFQVVCRVVASDDADSAIEDKSTKSSGIWVVSE